MFKKITFSICICTLCILNVCAVGYAANKVAALTRAIMDRSPEYTKVEGVYKHIRTHEFIYIDDEGNIYQVILKQKSVPDSTVYINSKKHRPFE